MSSILERISSALEAAGEALEEFTPGRIEAVKKAGGSPVTEADLKVDRVLHEILLNDGEGWLSEETRDNPERLKRERVWIVDPIDGTKEFVMGLPEWCISIGWVENGRAVAGGIYNPTAGHMILGSLETGVTLNGEPVAPRTTKSQSDATVLASRSEVGRGEWVEYEDRDFSITTMGSVAYKLGRVAAGLDDATWTLVPKNEWDIAAGVALLDAAGGRAFIPGQGPPTFNNENTLLPGLVAFAAGSEHLWADEPFTLRKSKRR